MKCHKVYVTKTNVADISDSGQILENKTEPLDRSKREMRRLALVV